jgi:hypothetical protein
MKGRNRESAGENRNGNGKYKRGIKWLSEGEEEKGERKVKEEIIGKEAKDRKGTGKEKKEEKQKFKLDQ